MSTLKNLKKHAVPTDEDLRKAIRVRVTSSGTPYVSSSTAAMSPRDVYELVERRVTELKKASKS